MTKSLVGCWLHSDWDQL